MLLHTDNLPHGYRLVAEMDYIFDNERMFVVVSEDELDLIVKAPAMRPDREDEPGVSVFQTEFPRASAAWIVDAVENKLWRSAAEGGLPSGTTSIKEEVAGETLKIRRSMNVSGPGEKGFNFINLSRPSLRFKTDNFQEIQITDTLLREGGLLDILKKL